MLPLLDAAASDEDPARVINISSIDSRQVSTLDTFAYSSGKAAVSHLTTVLAGKLGTRRITVNAILPGAFQSRVMRATLDAAGDAISKANPLGRIGDIKDMVGVSGDPRIVHLFSSLIYGSLLRSIPLSRQRPATSLSRFFAAGDTVACWSRGKLDHWRASGRGWWCTMQIPHVGGTVSEA